MPLSYKLLLHKAWVTITAPLSLSSKIFLALLAALILGGIAILFISPSWAVLWEVLTEMLFMSMVWRWLWLEGTISHMREGKDT